MEYKKEKYFDLLQKSLHLKNECEILKEALSLCATRFLQFDRTGLTHEQVIKYHIDQAVEKINNAKTI